MKYRVQYTTNEDIWKIKSHYGIIDDIGRNYKSFLCNYICVGSLPYLTALCRNIKAISGFMKKIIHYSFIYVKEKICITIHEERYKNNMCVHDLRSKA